MDEFRPFPKIARLNRDITITEKIDGTNGQVCIEDVAKVKFDPVCPPEGRMVHPDCDKSCLRQGFCTILNGGSHGRYLLRAGSRNRWVTPENDNAGFAQWAYGNAEALVRTLGPGRHYGEWWGAGIQRRYGMTEKRFSLFNTSRWYGKDLSAVPQLAVVPMMYEGPFDENAIGNAMADLVDYGSKAVPFMDPEGIVVYHHAANSMFKVTLKNDAMPKGLVNA